MKTAAQSAIANYHNAHRDLINRLIDAGFPHVAIEKELQHSLAFARAVNEHFGLMHHQQNA